MKLLANFLATLCLSLALLNCTGVGGLATGSKDGEGGGSPGGALDDFNSGNQVAGLGNPGPGPGGPTGAGGGMAGPGPINPGGPGDPPPGAGGGPSDPFGGVGGSPGSGGASPTGGSGECSGSVCTAETPSGFLIGKFYITASLFADPDTRGGNCNDLFPPPTTKEVCRYVVSSATHHSRPSLASLWMGTARALPRQQDGIGSEGSGERELVCSQEPFQPPIDANKIPHLVLRSDRRDLWTGEGNHQKLINDRTLIPECAVSGQWQMTTELIHVVLSPYSDDKNTWVIHVEALYPQDGTWVLRGTRTVTMYCSRNQTISGNIQCFEQIPSPLGEILAAPAQSNVLTR